MTQNISGQQGVIPYMPPIPQVDNQPYSKFIYGNDDGSSRCLQQQRGLLVFLIEKEKGQQAGSSSEHHGPVSVAPEQDLQSAIAESPG